MSKHISFNKNVIIPDGLHSTDVVVLTLTNANSLIFKLFKGSTGLQDQYKSSSSEGNRSV